MYQVIQFIYIQSTIKMYFATTWPRSCPASF